LGTLSWQATIQINIPVRRTLHCYGQLVRDNHRDICLAHKGGLGGGKFTVPTSHFSDLINGFDREGVQDGPRQRQYYVLGSLSDIDPLLSQIKKFVHEAYRIRLLRRSEVQFKRMLGLVGGSVADGNENGREYSEELGGGGAYSVRRRVKFERIHAEVQKALARELKKRKLTYGNRRQKHGLGPDLYIKDEHGRMVHLFEIKVGSDSQSTFTALGQLMVYSTAESPPPIATLVTRGLPQSPQFDAAMQKHKIRILYYKIHHPMQIRFDDLGRVLK
jgi:hypothetical protein